jgi:AcrR family transcriptional regulator
MSAYAILLYSVKSLLCVNVAAHAILGYSCGMTTKAGSEESRNERSYDLRERRRTRTRLMIQAEALRLFAEQGYTGTTVEQIADAAAISPRTFFRYFPTKEDVVLWDEYDPLVLELIEKRPAGEPPAATARAIIRESLGGVYRRDPEQLLARVRLISSVPELRARMLDTQRSGAAMFAAAIAQHQGRSVDELQARVLGAALVAAVITALELWQRDDGNSDLLALVDRATEALIEGVRELDVP